MAHSIQTYAAKIVGSVAVCHEQQYIVPMSFHYDHYSGSFIQGDTFVVIAEMKIFFGIL